MIFRFVDTMFHKRMVPLILVILVLTACGKADVSDTEHLNRAKQYQSTGDLKASLIELKNALQQNPKNSEARLMLGELYVLIGNGAVAEKELLRARELGVSSTFIETLLVKSMLQQQRNDDVLEILSNMNLEVAPLLMVQRGIALLGLGRASEAEQSFRKALNKNPKELEAYLWLIRLALSTNEINVADDLAKEIFSRRLENNEAWVLKGRIANKQKKYAEAEKAFQQALQLSSKNMILAIEMEARTEYSKVLISQRKFKGAVEQVDYLLKAAPKHPITNFVAALLAYEQKEYTQAKDYLQIVLQTAPNQLESMFLLGSTNYALGNLEQAETQLTQIVSRVPNLLSARMLLAEIRLKQNQSVQALEALEPIFGAASDNANLLAMIGQAALNSGQFEKGRRILEQALSKQAPKQGQRAQLAILYLAEGNQEQAIMELELAIKESSKPTREQSLLVLTYLRMKDLDNALQTAKRLVATEPENIDSLNLISRVYSVRGEIFKAREALDKALKLDPGYINTSLNLARLDALGGNVREAQKRLEEILLQDVKNVSVMMTLAQLAHGADNISLAIEWLEKARQADLNAQPPRIILAHYYLHLKKLVKAQKVIEEAVAIQPKNAQAIMLQGRLGLVSHDFTAAINTFRNLTEINPVADAYYWLAVANIQANKVKAANAAVNEIFRLVPEHFGAMTLQTVLDIRAKSYKEALRRVSKMKRVEPKALVSFELEGDIRAQLKQDALSLDAYRRARALGGKEEIFIKEVSVLRRSQGHEKANAEMMGWLQKHEDDARVRLSLAQAHAVTGKTQMAVSEYQKVLESEPENIVALNDLAWLLYQQNKTEEAINLAEAAYKLNPEYGPALDTLGWLKLEQGNIELALGLLREAVKVMPGNWEAGYHLAVVLVKTGKKDEASKILKEIVADGSDFPVKNEAKQLLNTL